MNKREAYYIKHIDEKQQLLKDFKKGVKVRSLVNNIEAYYGIVTYVDPKTLKVLVKWAGSSGSKQHDPEELILDVMDKRKMDNRGVRAVSQQTKEKAESMKDSLDLQMAVSKMELLNTQLAEIQELLNKVGIKAETKLWKDISKLFKMSVLNEFTKEGE